METSSSPQKQPDESHSDHTLQEDKDVVPPEFICPLTLDVMKDPVVTRYGQSYEREAILEWLITNMTDPMTRQPLRLQDVVTNHKLKLRLRQWQRENDMEITIIYQADDTAIGYLDLSDVTERTDDPQVLYELVRPPQHRQRRRLFARFRRRPQVIAV